MCIVRRNRTDEHVWIFATLTLTQLNSKKKLKLKLFWMMQEVMF